MLRVINKEEIEDFAFVLRDNIFVRIVDNTEGQYEDAPRVSKLLEIEVSDYRPQPHEKWDVDEWEARQGHILAPATRQFWPLAWRLARALSRCGSVFIEGNDVTCELPCVTVLS